MEMLRVKYRPNSFEEFLGNESVVKSILKKIEREQCYFLYGRPGFFCLRA